jgi:hypothetical protein
MNRAFAVLMLVLLGAQAAAAQALTGSAVLRVAGADTVRTNLWLAQALLADVVRDAAAALPPGSDVVLVSRQGHAADPLMETAAHAVLSAAGHTVYRPDDDEADEEETVGAVLPEAGYELGWRLEDVKLEYPRVGRFLGLWSRWIDRDLEAAAVVSVRDRTSGRLLVDRRIVKTYTDRIGSSRLAAVNSNTYAFTSAQPSERGLRGILEEIVIIGALTSMVAVYFSNSGS